MIKIKNENELLGILKIFAQESVNKARRSLNENSDPAQSKYAQALERDELFYGNLTEQEDEEAEEDNAETDADNEDADNEDADNEQDQDTTDQEKPEDVELDPEEFGASFDSVVKDLNTLRSGKSTKNKDVKENLLDYYDRLDESERRVLHLFLKELSDILQGAVTGQEAQDPSDPPFNINMTGNSEEETDDRQSSSGDEKSSRTAAPAGEEDITPPIKVNESQDLYEIRRRVKNLMKRY